MGYAIVFAPCIRCNNISGFNPRYVPSIRINGVREPICRECIPEVNEMRKEAGTEPIVPHPDAYEPIDEHEL